MSNRLAGSFAGFGRIGVFLDLIRFEHTIFALPFAYSGMLLAARGTPTWRQFFWITIAMAGARTAAMAFNRYADRYLDARNPRTADRPIQRGLIGAAAVLGFASLSLLVLAFAAYQLNPLAFRLWPVALALLVGYSYTKRFTWLCHYVLGATDAMAPLGAWVAVTGSLLSQADLAGWLLAAGVMTWIAGFDILYALQDIEVDRREGLFSIPARFGIVGALRTARGSHAVALILFAATGWAARMGPFYWLGLAVVGALFFWQHRLVRPHQLDRIDVAFFKLNSAIALVLLLAVVSGIYLA